MNVSKRYEIDFATCPPGRMLSHNKRAPEGHIVVWNGNLCTVTKGKTWFGDIDLTDDADALKAYAKKLGEDVYVLREMDARFDTANKPKFERAVAIVSPSHGVVLCKGKEVW